MTIAQQQVKVLLGDSFNKLEQLSQSVDIFVSLGKDQEWINNTVCSFLNIPMSDTLKLMSALDTYNKYFKGV